MICKIQEKVFTYIKFDKRSWCCEKENWNITFVLKHGLNKILVRTSWHLKEADLTKLSGIYTK